MLRGWAICWSDLWGSGVWCQHDGYRWWGEFPYRLWVLAVLGGGLTDQTRNLCLCHRHWVKCEPCLHLLLLSPSPSSSSLLSDIISNLVLKKSLGVWAKSASSTAVLQGGDKKTNNCLKCLWLPDATWQAQSRWWGWDCGLLLAFRSWEDASWAQHQKQPTLSLCYSHKHFPSLLIILHTSRAG